MARPRTIEDQELLVVARTLFLAQGLHVTNAEIAARAGVSEATVLRRFPSKEALFLASMEIPSEPPWSALARTLAEDERPMEPRLRELCHAILDFFRTLLPRLVALRAAGVDLHEHFQSMDIPPPIAGMRAVAALFRRATERGELDAHDAEVPARMLIGAMHHLAFLETCGFAVHAPISSDTYVNESVSILLRGLGAKEPG